jgi:hypothetical protein
MTRKNEGGYGKKNTTLRIYRQTKKHGIILIIVPIAVDGFAKIVFVWDMYSTTARTAAAIIHMNATIMKMGGIAKSAETNYKPKLERMVTTMKKILVLALALVMALSLAACGGNDTDTPSGNNGGNNSQTQAPAGNDGDNTATEGPEAAFAQFGLNLNDVIPGIGTVNETVLENSNEVSDSAFRCSAAYLENSETEIDEAAGNAYNQKMFDLCKAASVDGKIYKNKTLAGDEPDEITSIDDLIDPSVTRQMITWSYKIDGKWVDVYMNWNLSGDEIGIELGGAGKY